MIDGTPCAVKVARTVWGGGKLGDNIKKLPIAHYRVNRKQRASPLHMGNIR